MIPGIVAAQQLGQNAAGISLLTHPMVFLCSFDGADGATTSIDESAWAHTPTFLAQAQLDTAQAKFGASSLLLNPAVDSDRVTIGAGAELLLADNRFGVEMFIRPTANALLSLSSLWQQGDASPQFSWRFELNSTTLRFRASTNGTSLSTWLDVAHGMSADTWYHVAADRDINGILRIYREGSMLGSVDMSGTSFFASTDPVSIGGTSNGFNIFNGHIDEARMFNGSTPYGTDSGFAPPSAPF